MRGGNFSIEEEKALNWVTKWIRMLSSMKGITYEWMNEVEGIRYIAFLMKQFHDQAIESFSYPVANEMNESGHDDDES